MTLLAGNHSDFLILFYSMFFNTPVLAAAINCACVALADAGIEMYDLVTACSLVCFTVCIVHYNIPCGHFYTFSLHILH